MEKVLVESLLRRTGSQAVDKSSPCGPACFSALSLTDIILMVYWTP